MASVVAVSPRDGESSSTVASRWRRRAIGLVAAAALPVVLGGCQLPTFDGYRGSTKQGHDESLLWIGTMFAAIFVLVLVGGLIVWSVIRYRRRSDEMLVADFFVLHQLAINALYCTLKFGAVPVPNVQFVQWLSFHAPFVQGLRLIPDGYAEWKTPSGIDGSFIEVDLGHEALSIWKEKAKHYLQLALSGAFERQFKQPRFRVLVVANSERRMQSIRVAVARVTQKIFWFATQEAAQGEKFFCPVWLRPVEREHQPIFKENQ